MFFHRHPYQPYIPKNATKLIVGTIPPPRFTEGNLFEEDVNFCYGSKYGLLWPILDNIFKLELDYQNTQMAINQRKFFLQQNLIGICDIVASCERSKIDASDLGMQNIKLRNILQHLSNNPTIHTILFMGGNSKNGPEYFFRQHLKSNKILLQNISDTSPKIHQFNLEDRTIKTVSLISPSNAANRSIGANPLFKKIKKTNSKFTTTEYRIRQYKNHFL